MAGIMSQAGNEHDILLYDITYTMIRNDAIVHSMIHSKEHIMAWHIMAHHGISWHLGKILVCVVRLEYERFLVLRGRNAFCEVC